MIRSSTNGPRSLMRTTVDRPFSRFFTERMVFIGRVLWAAVSPYMS